MTPPDSVVGQEKIRLLGSEQWNLHFFLHRTIAGDIHLAMFRVRKMIVEVPSETDKTQQETKTEVVSAAVEDTTS